jgi:5'-3' exoribonuclease 1
MGIPSYFSHVIKEHRKIIKQISSKKSGNTEYLFLDSNSIIYDVIRSLEYSEKDNNFEKNAIHEICKQIKYYIQLIKPTQKTMIAFDGVAPVAKLKQQQSRRYKNAYLKHKFPKKNPEWNTSAITPGTDFMKKLSHGVTTFFSKYSSSVIVSTSDEFGEGEHKIFHYIRENQKELENKSLLVYGLDADLIMLTLQHLRYCPKIYLFRETPHFIKSIDKTLNPNELYALDIPQFAKIITNDLGTTPKESAISDYIFISFMLGNDFIPHMPALNIRTNGIDHIFDAYKATISGKTYLTKDGKINWCSFKKFIDYLAKNEYQYIKYEYGLREKQEKRVLRTMNNKSAEEKWDVSPQINRGVEHYINPSYNGWQWRYYKTLTDIDINHVSKRNICINYLEALEWTLHYYTFGCKNTKWSYHYMYPPLLEDLTNYIPSFNNDLVDVNNNPISAETQLAYVLPESSSHLLTAKMRDKMRKYYNKNAVFDIEGAFCKYFWEAHIKISPISLYELET